MLDKKNHTPKEVKEDSVSPAKTGEGNESETELKALLEKSLHWSQIIYDQNKAIKSRLTWMAVLSWLRFFLILVPLIVGLIFLPPLIRQVWGQYASLLGGGSSSNNSNYDINSLIEDVGADNVKEFLKKLETK